MIRFLASLLSGLWEGLTSLSQTVESEPGDRGQQMDPNG